MTQYNLETAVPIAALDADINSTVTSLDVGSGEGATLPTEPFIIGINEEAMEVTNVATDTLTVVRGFGGTTAASHTAADDVVHIFTAEFFGLLPDDTDDSFYAQGDIDLDGNELIGHSETLAGLTDVDLTGIADGDYLSVTTGTYVLETTVPTPTAVPSSGTPANAIDGNTSTYWTALCSSGVMGINFDFGKSVTLSRIRIRYGASYGAPFAIRKSTDGSTWTDVAVYGNTIVSNSYVNHDFTETSSRYWRLEERTTSGSYWRLYEVDFWGQQNEWTAVDGGTNTLYESNSGEPSAASSSTFATKGNIVRPRDNMKVHAITYFGSIVSGASYKAYVMTYSGTTVSTVTASTAYTADTNDVGTASTSVSPTLRLVFATPVALTAGTAYLIAVGRTDSTDTYGLPVQYPSATGSFSFSQYLPAGSGRIAKATPAASDTIDIFSTGIVRMGVEWEWV